MIEKALSLLSPNAEWSVLNGQVTWLSPDIIQPTSSEINAKVIELEAAEPLRLLRVERNRKIAETDWWASSDLTMTSEQTTYRQALRDITNSYQSLDDVVWPTKP